MSTSSEIVQSHKKQRMDRHQTLLELYRQQHRRMQEGPVVVTEGHPSIGPIYQRLSTEALHEFLSDANIFGEDSRFTGFHLVFGTHGHEKAPFVCIKSRLVDDLHLLIGGGE